MNSRSTTCGLLGAGLGLVLPALVWLVAVHALGGAPPPPARADTRAQGVAQELAGARMRVEVRVSRAQAVYRSIELHGESAPSRQVVLRAQTPGRVVHAPERVGEALDAGTLLARIAPGARGAAVAEAEAVLAHRRSVFEAARKVAERGLGSALSLREAAADQAAAAARLAAAREDLAHTRISTPFEGVVAARSVEPGSYVGVGDELARLVDLDPLRVVVHVAQQHVGALEEGMAAQIILADGRVREAPVRSIAPEANPATRTYRVEIEMPNPEGYAAGAAVRVGLRLSAVQAHRLSPSQFDLDAEGRVGVQAVGADDRVVFHPIEVVRAEPGGVWVSGLPERLRVITRGGGFVAVGERVEPVERAGE